MAKWQCCSTRQMIQGQRLLTSTHLAMASRRSKMLIFLRGNYYFFFLNNGGMKERQQRRGQARSLIACNCVTWINNQVLHWKNEFRWVQVTVVTSLESFPILEGISKMLPNSWESSYLPVLDKLTYYLQIKGIQNSLGRAKELADNQSSCCWIDT